MRHRINSFLLVVTAFLAFWFVYLGHQLIGLTDLNWPMKSLCFLALALPFSLVLWLPLVHWQEESPVHSKFRDRLAWSSFISMGWLSFIFLVVVLRDFAWVILRDSRLYGPTPSLVVLALAIALLVVGMLAARRSPVVTSIDIPIKNLPTAFIGYRIAQLSDVHISRTMRRGFMERLVETTNSLHADTIALTGDIFDGEVAELAEHSAHLRNLKAPDGCYYVTGNHEYYWGAAQWVAEAARLGLNPLINSHALIRRGDESILIAGVADYWASRNSPGDSSDSAAALLGAPVHVTSRILLAHQPASATLAAPLGFSLQLSGHTHGGQFIPWTLLVRLFHKFSRGLHRLDGMWIYVNRGTGHWGPPVRLGSRSEITVVRLLRHESS